MKLFLTLLTLCNFLNFAAFADSTNFMSCQGLLSNWRITLSFNSDNLSCTTTSPCATRMLETKGYGGLWDLDTDSIEAYNVIVSPDSDGKSTLYTLKDPRQQGMISYTIHFHPGGSANIGTADMDTGIYGSTIMNCQPQDF